MAQPTWFEDMAKRVREVQRDEAGNLTTESYLHVCEGNLKIFTVIFNGYVTAPPCVAQVAGWQGLAEDGLRLGQPETRSGAASNLRRAGGARI